MFLLRNLINKARKAWSLEEDTEKFVDGILRGDDVTDVFLSKALLKPEINEELLRAEDNLERIEMVIEFFPFQDFKAYYQDICEVMGKNDYAATKLIEKADELEDPLEFKSKLRCLNLAASFSTTEKTLVDIYGKRAALLFDCEDWAGCRHDAELARHLDCPKGTAEELQFLSQKSHVIQVFKSLTVNKSEKERRYRLRDKHIFELHGGKHAKIPVASDVIEIKWNETQGRRLFVTKDVNPGKTLIIEDPYTTALSRGLKLDYGHCWKCLKMIQSTVPCPGCVFAVYCSEKCLLEDKKFGHKYECPCLPYLHGARVSSNVHLGYKSICRAGPGELYRIFTTIRSPRIEKYKGFNRITGKYDSKSYLPIMSLEGHIDKSGKLPYYVWVAIGFAEVLDLTTDFFSRIASSKKNGFKNYVASLALHHNTSVEFNSIGLSEELGLSKDSHSQGRRDYQVYAGGLYPVISLLNHSCHASVGRINLTNGKMAIISLRGLKAGEELHLNYGYEFESHPLNLRQDMLNSRYHFKCECPPCRFDWPLLKDLTRSILCCPKCSDVYGYDQYVQSDRCGLTDKGNGLRECPSCLEEFSVHKHFVGVLEVDKVILSKCKELLLANDPASVIFLLSRKIKWIQTKLCQPSIELCSAQQLLMRAYYSLIDT